MCHTSRLSFGPVLRGCILYVTTHLCPDLYYSYTRRLSVTISLPSPSSTIIALSQPDTRYFKNLEGKYTWSFDFVLFKKGQTESLGSSNTKFDPRNTTLKINLDAGDYVVHASSTFVSLFLVLIEGWSWAFIRFVCTLIRDMIISSRTVILILIISLNSLKSWQNEQSVILSHPVSILSDSSLRLIYRSSQIVKLSRCKIVLSLCQSWYQFSFFSCCSIAPRFIFLSIWIYSPVTTSMRCNQRTAKQNYHSRVSRTRILAHLVIYWTRTASSLAYRSIPRKIPLRSLLDNLGMSLWVQPSSLKLRRIYTPCRANTSSAIAATNYLKAPQPSVVVTARDVVIIRVCAL